MIPIDGSWSSLLGLIFLFLFLGVMLYFTWSLRHGPLKYGRKITAIGRLRRTIGLSVETGRRLHISLGRGSLFDLQAGAALVGLRVLQRIATSTLVSDRPPLSTAGESQLGILAQDTLQHTFRQANQTQLYDPGQARITGLTPFSYAAGTMPLFKDEKLAALILAGHFGSEVGLLIEAAERNNCLTVGGSDDLAAQAILFASAQEPLIGEELYATAAYLGTGPSHTASIRTQDLMRWIISGVLVLGAVLKLVGAI